MDTTTQAQRWSAERYARNAGFVAAHVEGRCRR